MIIKQLQDELEKESKRRRDYAKSYKAQVKEIELDRKDLERIKKQSDKMEERAQRKEQEAVRKEAELDMVPSREAKKPAKKHQLQDHPIFFKGSKITSQIPK